MSIGKSSVHAAQRQKLTRQESRRHSMTGTTSSQRSQLRRAARRPQPLPFHQPMQTPVLVLNASYEPINICGARRALVLVLKGVAKTEEEQGATLHAARIRMPLALGHPPARVPPYPPPRPAPSPARTSCYATATPASTAHRAPRRRAHPRPRPAPLPAAAKVPGKTSSPAATNCNRRKGNQLLHELETMKLLREPRPFSLHTSRHIMRMIATPTRSGASTCTTEWAHF